MTGQAGRTGKPGQAPASRIAALASATPDQDTAKKDLECFHANHPEEFDALGGFGLAATARLVAYSRFLAAYILRCPDALHEALDRIDQPVTKSFLAKAFAVIKASNPLFDGYQLLREAKKKFLLHITLRYVMRKTDIIQCMEELSHCADLLIGEALALAKAAMEARFGLPEGDSFCAIALGKLGAMELNYSSDVDLLFVYGQETGDTCGITDPRGTGRNRITAHEFYCKVVEALSKLLNVNTAEGFVYRVDLRLRPEGQKGQLALPPEGYELYYESWGREWERLALIRARPVAGNHALGIEFLAIIRPFVYRKYMDMGTIDEIRKLKDKIDAGHGENDIKKGYGGIREIEFFTQALQLVYGGREPLLQERGVLIVLHRLQQKNLIGLEDYSILSTAYLYLRRLEQVIQMENDLQTHTLPASVERQTLIARKMGHLDRASFLNELTCLRREVKRIFTSLLRLAKGEPDRQASLLNLPAEEIMIQLQKKRLKGPEKVLAYIKKIKEGMHSFQTLQSRRSQDTVIPDFVRKALESSNPEAALRNVLHFLDILKIGHTYLELFHKQESLVKAFVELFAASDYLSSMVIGNTRYMDMFAGGTAMKKTLATKIKESAQAVHGPVSPGEALTAYRKSEEIRLGMLFLNKKLTVTSLLKGFTKTAESILTSCMEIVDPAGRLFVAGYGKLGGRELTIGSDLDIILLSQDGPQNGPDDELYRKAEKFLRIVTSYTKEGMTYRVDTRLRPQGSKGPLVNGLAGLREYYLEKAYPWEIQALMKARPITGTLHSRRKFLEIVTKTVLARGRQLTGSDITSMRQKIKKEHIKNTEELNIKLADGGIEDIEFALQYLQLRHACRFPGLLVQSTLTAIRRLAGYGLLTPVQAAILRDNYLFYRTVETFLRLKGEKTIGPESDFLESMAQFLDLSGVVEPFLEHLKGSMAQTKEIVDSLLTE